MALPQSKPPAAFRKLVLATVGEDYGDKTVCLCPTAFVRLFNGDHQAAILLAQILYWTDRTKDPDGWFYKSYDQWKAELGLSEFQVRRILNGDKRVQSRRVSLREMGIETVVKKVKATGAPVTHFRVDQARFLATLKRLLGQGNPEQCPGSITDKVGDELSTESAMKPEQCGPSSDLDSEITNPEILAEDHGHQNPAHLPDEDSDLDIFFSYESRFGNLKERFHGPFRAELTRLGATKVREVLDRCATRGRSWVYVQRALSNEAAAPELQDSGVETRYGGLLAFNDDQGLLLQPTSADALLAVSERLQVSWPGGADAHATVRDAWHAVLPQLELQLDQASFNSCLRDATLVDFDPASQAFVVVVRTSYARDFLQGRLDRTVKRILSDVYGQRVTLKYLLKEDWGEVQETVAIA